jgi:hypothetical protein
MFSRLKKNHCSSKPAKSYDRVRREELRMRLSSGSSHTSDDGRFLSRLKRFVSRWRMRDGRGSVKANPRAVVMKSPLSRRCSVRVGYVKNKQKGQWGAAGYYIEEDFDDIIDRSRARNNTEKRRSLRGICDDWQKAGDKRMFKFIISPEDGARVDMKAHTERVMKRVLKEAGLDGTEWVAAIHYDTDNPHAHVMLRGVDKNGKNYTLDPGFIKTRIREIAEEDLTAHLGYRTRREIDLAREKEIESMRYTGLDRELSRKAENDQPVADTILLRRLKVLESWQLAERRNGRWHLSDNFEKSLRTMAIANDRLKTIARNRNMFSSPDIRPAAKTPDLLVGRVIAGGISEKTDLPWLLIEGVDGKAHWVNQSRKMGELRRDGQIKNGDIIVIERKSFTDSTGKEIKYVAAKGYDTFSEIPTQVRRNVKEIGNTKLASEFKQGIGHGMEI